MIDPRVLIAVPTNAGRAVVPVGLVDLLCRKPQTWDIKFFSGLRIDAQRNQIINWALTHQYTHLMFIDDDMGYKAEENPHGRNPLEALFAALQKAQALDPQTIGVSGLYCAKSYPFHFFLHEEGQWARTVDMHEIGEFGTLRRSFLIGTGCLIVDLKKISFLAPPWFLLSCDRYGTLTQTEDCYFAQLADSQGYTFYVDVAERYSHIDMISFPDFWAHPYLHYKGKILIDEQAKFGNIRLELPTGDGLPLPKPAFQPTCHIDQGIILCAHPTIIQTTTGAYICTRCGQEAAAIRALYGRELHE
jgi:hypothetical protein